MADGNLGVVDRFLRFVGIDRADLTPSVAGGADTQISPEAAVQRGELEKLLVQIHHIDGRIKRVSDDIAEENAKIRAQLAPYANRARAVPSMTAISVRAMRATRAELEKTLKQMYTMRMRLISHMHNIENAACQKAYTRAIQTTQGAPEYGITENDIRTTETVMETQREYDYMRNEWDAMVSQGTSLGLDDGGVEAELDELFAITVPDTALEGPSSRESVAGAEYASDLPPVPAHDVAAPSGTRRSDLSRLIDMMD